MWTDTLDDELDFIEYRNLRRIYGKGYIPGAVAHFGAAKVAAMEIRYGMELAIGLISESTPSVEACPTCARKHYPVCKSVSRDEWNRELK